MSEEEAEIMRAYVQFIAEYGRSYATKEHASEKYEVFKRNYQTIKVYNKEQRFPFTLGVNQFADITPEEFAQMNKLEVPKALAVKTQNAKVEEDEHQHSHAPHVHSDEHFEG